jgi:hypothetical protein
MGASVFGNHLNLALENGYELLRDFSGAFFVADAY